MMRVIFCVSSIGALGETYSTALFANQLLEQGHECFFILSKLGSEYLKTFGFKTQCMYILPSGNVGKKDLNENYKLFSAFVSQVSPDFVVVVDWHQFDEEGFTYNYSYSINWFDDNVKIGTLDHFGFAPQGKEVKVHENFETGNKIFSPLPGRYSFIIRPCPHHDNALRQTENVFYWSLFKEKFSSERDTDVLRKQFSLRGSKIILHPIGFWQQRILEREFQKSGIKCDYYFDVLLPIIYDYISQSCIDATYIIISGNIKKEVKSFYKNIEIISKPPLSNELYTSLLLVSDIFITDNLMSSNLGKAVFAKKIPIVFKNSFNQLLDKAYPGFGSTPLIKEKFSFLEKNKLLFPYLSFPLGFNELKDMYQNNSFSSTFFHQELFDELSNLQLFSDLFNNKEAGSSISNFQDQYINNNRKLFLAHEILDHIS
jgi:hypothetical protein